MKLLDLLLTLKHEKHDYSIGLYNSNNHSLLTELTDADPVDTLKYQYKEVVKWEPCIYDKPESLGGGKYIRIIIDLEIDE